MTIRVLLIAEAANPEWTSVPLVGWSHYRALAEVAEVHLVTQVRNRDAILRAGLREGDDFTAIDSEVVARPLWRVASLLRGGEGKGWTTVTAIAPISYYYFEYAAWKQFGSRVKAGEFDLVHRLTPLSPTTPSIMASRCAKVGVPFVLGPLNGGVPWPKEFDRERRKEKEWLAPVRRAYRLLPGQRGMLKHSAAIIAGSRFTQSQIPERHQHKTHYIPENAIDPKRFSLERTRRAELPLRLVFIGRLVPYKGADMAIEAARPLLEAGNATFTIVGDGPERERLQELASDLVAAGAVTFAGNVPHEKVQNYLAESDLFVFPSVREFGGAVVLEAMAMGCVPVIVDYGGPAELVTNKTGVTVPIGDRKSIIRCLRYALDELTSDPVGIRQMAEAGPRYIRESFTWFRKAEQVASIYEQLVHQRGA